MPQFSYKAKYDKIITALGKKYGLCFLHIEKHSHFFVADTVVHSFSLDVIIEGYGYNFSHSYFIVLCG